MVKAICLTCGGKKKVAWKQCNNCGFTPVDDIEALVRSVYLSVGRFESDDDQKSYEIELETLGEKLRRGEQIDFESQELYRLREQYETVGLVSGSNLFWTLIRIFLPGFLFLLASAIVLVILKLL